MSRAFTVNAWRFSLRGPDGTPWDQIAKYGTFDKGGKVEFNATTLGQMLADFASRKNDLSADYDHQALKTDDNGKPAPAVAFYDSLALCEGGKVIGFATHTDGVSPPDASAWQDGLYARRSELTALGQELLPSYRWISPAFVTDGADEQGNPTGYQLLNVAWTNIPFLDGMEPLTFHRLDGKAIAMARSNGLRVGDKVRNKLTGEIGIITSVNNDGVARVKWDGAGTSGSFMPAPLPPEVEKLSKTGAAGAFSKGATAMADDLYKRLGLDDGASPDEMKAAMSAYLKKMDDDAAAMDDADAMDDGSDQGDGAMKKMDGDKDDADKKPFDDADAMDDAEAMDDDAMKKMSKEALVERLKVLKFSHAPKTEVAALSKKVVELEQKLAKAEQAKTLEAAVKFAKSAIDAGRWNPKEEKALVDLRVREPGIAEKALQPQGTWTALKRFTKGGAPIGVEREAQGDYSGDTDGVIGGGLSAEAKKYAAEKGVAFDKALDIVSAQKPHLYKRGA